MDKTMMTNKLRSVITLVDKLRDINLQSYIKLPKIVAVGSQSAGKSSLVEQVVGIDFLPRGSGVVTRRPLQIRMVYSPNLNQPYSMFQQIPGKKFTNFNEVKQAIETVTDNVCGKNKNIVDKPIILNVFSPFCPNLTMIDLPGLTRISLQSQSTNIHQITSNMIKKYIEDPNTIILCVISANQDITNDEVLFMARKIDKQGIRTIGCITKIDIMDRGTDARQLLLNKAQVEMKLGFVGIKGRSQADINQNKTVQQGLQAQKMFFSKSPIYSSLPIQCLGTSSLVNKLTKVLQQSINRFLPELLTKIRQRKQQLQAITKQYGKPLPKTSAEKQSLTWQICNMFMREYKKSISGEISMLRQGQSLLKIHAKIREDLSSVLEDQFLSNPVQFLTDKQVLFAITKYEGSNLPGFPSIHTFLFLIDPLLQRLKFPLANCLQGIYDSMQHMADLIITQIAHEYISFRQYLVSKTAEILSIYRKQSSQFITQLMSVETNYIYTNNPLFQEDCTAIIQPNQLKSQLSKKYPMIVILKKRVAAYYKVVIKNLRDLIPKNIHYMLFKLAIQKLQFEIFQDSGFGSSKAQSWFSLSDNTMKQRLKIQQQFDIISKAQAYLLSHGGFAEIRKKQFEKKRLEKQKERQEKLKQQAKISKQKNKNQAFSPIKQQSTNKVQVQKSIEKNVFPANQIQKPKPPTDKTFAQLFGTTKIKKNQLPMPVIEQQSKGNNYQINNNQPSNAVNVNKRLFGNIQPQRKQKEGFTDMYNKQVGKATDKAVDQIYQNEKFKEKSKQAVENGASLAAQKQLGVSEQSGKSLGKAAGWLFGTDTVQNHLKQQSKKAARSQTQIIKKP